MRRVSTLGIGIIAVAVLVTPGTAGASVHNVSGTMTGAGGLVAPECSTGLANLNRAGSFTAKKFGLGSYRYAACQTPNPDRTYTLTGPVLFRFRSGAKLRGAINSNFNDQAGDPTFSVTVTSGTRRFAHARGSLLFGPFIQSNFSNCAHGICFNWDETGPLTGTLRRVGR